MIRFAVTHSTNYSPPPRARECVQAIDKYQKRAARLLKKEIGTAAYSSLWSRWRNHSRWMKNNLYRHNYRFPFPDYSRRLRRRFIDGMMLNAIRGLWERQTPPPDEKNLRHWIRLCARYIRRGRVPFGFPELIADKEDAQRYLADFVIVRMNRLKKKLNSKPMRRYL
jgi:hypothetical protein